MTDGSPSGLEATRLLALIGDDPRTIVHMTHGERRAEAIARALRDMAPGLRAAFLVPWDCLPYDRASPSPAAMGRRMALLRQLADPETAPRIIVTTPAALLQRVPPMSAVTSLALRIGGALDVDAFARFCEGAGYRRDDRVDEPGEMAIRGEVADVFPADQGSPVRLQFGDGRLLSIRRFDPATQITTDELQDLVLDAASEMPTVADDAGEHGAEHGLAPAHGSLATIADHLGPMRLTTTRLGLEARTGAMEQILEAHRDRMRHEAESGSRRTAPPEALYLSEKEWAVMVEEAEVLDIEEGVEDVPKPALDSRPRAALAAVLRDQMAAGRRVVLAAATAADRDRLARMARAAGTGPEPTTWEAALVAAPGTLSAVEATLEQGFVDVTASLAVITARDVLGSRAEDGDATASVPWTIEATSMRLGDIVVHEDHGAARLDGLEPMGEAGDGEAIRLIYADGHTLMVPAADAGLLWRYGAAEEEVTLDRLGGTVWGKRRATVARSLKGTAKALVDAAEARAAREARRLVPPQAPYERMVARFPYDITPDQARAVRAVLDDLASGQPMNRLLIGDVGFGKTEVALRAAAAAALAGGQVAVVAPTTVLARQHAEVFRRRLESLGIEVAHLSRLVPAGEARRVREGLADGSVRIVVGTHAVLAKGVTFADLALVVIDEEQRFGAADKRRLREMGEEAHLLAMSATPIPRSLQGALAGLQDLSLLTTPPARRRPVRTSLTGDDDLTLRQALLRESRRGGQSFVVVPRIEDIEGVAERLAALLPDLSVRVAHGGMVARAIDEAMVGFAQGDGDVLLATSLIESGLDVPAANTMVVMRPALFGLAQLHQLRGRVGRGPLQAYCLLASAEGETLDEGALRRLGTLQALDRLGAGMAIAAQDLDLRGGGDLFGEDQTGHTRLIGPGLHQAMLAQALREARGEAARETPVALREEAPGHLPETYVPEPDLRLDLYYRLARADDPDAVETLASEIEDRFGSLPDPAQRLLDAARIRVLAHALGVHEVSAGPEAIALAFGAGSGVETDDLAWDGPPLEWIDGRLVARLAIDDARARGGAVLDLLEALA